MKNLNRVNQVNSSIDPAVTEIGVQERAQQTINELESCISLTKTTLEYLTGEGNADSEKAPISNNLQSMTHEVFSLSCQLRNNLDRINRVLDPAFDKPKAVAGVYGKVDNGRAQ